MTRTPLALAATLLLTLGCMGGGSDAPVTTPDVTTNTEPATPAEDPTATCCCEYTPDGATSPTRETMVKSSCESWSYTCVDDGLCSTDADGTDAVNTKADSTEAAATEEAATEDVAPVKPKSTGVTVSGARGGASGTTRVGGTSTRGGSTRVGGSSSGTTSVRGGPSGKPPRR